MVELAIGDISAGRPAERFTAHSGSNHLDGNIRRALERRTAAQSNNIGATFRHLRLDFSPPVFSQGIRADHASQRFAFHFRSRSVNSHLFAMAAVCTAVLYNIHRYAEMFSQFTTQAGRVQSSQSRHLRRFQT